MRGVDFASRATGASIKAEGFEFVFRYVPYGPPKGLTAAEVADFRANGLHIGLVFERNEERPLEGKSAGVTDALISHRAATDLGFPAGQPIFFAVDMGLTQAQLPIVADYFRGVVGSIGVERVGCYGGETILRYLLGRGLITFMWEAMPSSWGNGPMPGRHFWQHRNAVFIPSGDRNGTPVDYNLSYEGAEQSLWLAEDGMSQEQEARLARVEQILAANGVDSDGDGEADMTGEAALAHLDDLGVSHALTLSRQNAAILDAQARITALEAGAPLVPAGIAPHTHEPGEVQV